MFVKRRRDFTKDNCMTSGNYLAKERMDCFDVAVLLLLMPGQDKGTVLLDIFIRIILVHSSW